MVADYFTKPLQGSLFLKLKNIIMIKVPTIEERYEKINKNKNLQLLTHVTLERIT